MKLSNDMLEDIKLDYNNKWYWK